MKNETKIVEQIIKRYGEVLNLKENPSVIIDIIRRFGQDDGGLPPGGTPEPPPGPTSFQDQPTNEDIMKQLLKVTKKLNRLQKQLNAE